MSSEPSLACGADPDALLAQVAEGRGDDRDPHQSGCLHCRATLAEYARLWAPFDELAATEVQAPPGLFDRALASVREQAGPVGFGRVGDEEGSFLVAARAVVSVAGYAARTSAGVRMALGAIGALGELVDARTGPASEPRSVGAGVSGQSVAVELAVAAEYGHDLQRLADHLRERVVAEVSAQTGLDVVVVAVAITDVFSPREPPPSRD